MTHTFTGQCHCGAVQFSVELENGLDNPIRCNCSLCTRKNALMHPIPMDQLRITKGADNLGLYQWNTKVAKHYFCKTCGIYTHHQRRSNPQQFSFNLGCIDKLDLSTLPTPTWVDGKALS